MTQQLHPTALPQHKRRPASYVDRLERRYLLRLGRGRARR
jgi:hypothetical protein